MTTSAPTKDEEPEVSYGPVPIQTPQDAAMAYLRGQISEDKLREICGKFGVLPGQLLPTPTALERPDAAFENSLPDDLFLPVPAVKDDLEARQKAAEEKQKARDEATKEAEKTATPVPAPAPVPVTSSTKTS